MANPSGWNKWFGWMATQMQPVLHWYVRAANLGPGQRVLDVGCGSGMPSVHVGGLVRPGGSVLAVDVSAEMTAGTLAHAREAGLDNLEVREMDMHALAVEDGGFDAVTSGFALMFCAEREKAAAEMRRALRPGGRLAVAVWSERHRNPLFTTLFGTITRFVPSFGPPADPKAPGQFRLGPPGELEAVLRAAGFTEIAVEEVEVPHHYESAEEYWEIFSEVAPMAAAPILALPADEQAQFHEALRDALAPFATERGFRLPAVARCASARA
jgi:ubiquinone/menaquinone biosynthesis C-methylase UbiE